MPNNKANPPILARSDPNAQLPAAYLPGLFPALWCICLPAPTLIKPPFSYNMHTLNLMIGLPLTLKNRVSRKSEKPE
ncbi:MAG: hypothetical protein ABSB41_18540 [Anaerolineales bacterium]|jgi:hypothetical protein